MYLKNLKSEYTLRRNPDRAVIRTLNLIDWLSKSNIKDIRLAGIYAQKAETSNVNLDKYVLHINEMRWGYYLLDWQDEQINPTPDYIGRWESFFWTIINNQNLNRFLRGNPDFIIKIMQHAILSPEEFLNLFIEKVLNCNNSDELRKKLLEYGDISVSDNGGSNNIGPNWMERRCLLGCNHDESYWDTFMNGENSTKNATIVTSYLLNNQNNKITDPIIYELGNNLEYMKQKYFLWSEDQNQCKRVILLEKKQASKSKARELCVQYLHKQIVNSWIWDHNYCVYNFAPNKDGLNDNIEDKNTGYYIDLWYDWEPSGGKWYCRIGHKEHDLSDNVIASILAYSVDLPIVDCNWTIEYSNRKSLSTNNPIYIEKIGEDYFTGACFVKKFFDEILTLLQKINSENIL